MSSALAPPRSKRRLLVPARREEPRETLVTAGPFFLRTPGADPAPEVPPLLSLEGDEFMEALMTAIADPARWPKLLPWRDWAEPPAGVLDGNGAARYPSAVFGRAKPDARMFERDPAIGTEDGIPASTPPWFRKLYLPLHQRFTFIAFDVLCRRAGWPAVARERVIGAGAVVRRMRPKGAALPPDWEDWISADGRRGVWVKLAQAPDTANPIFLPHAIPPLDPEALGPAAYKDIEPSVRARLGLGVQDPLPAALDSARLTLLPPDAAMGAAARHCTLHGYISLFSSAEQVTEVTATTAAAIQAELKDKASAAILRLSGAMPAVAARVGDALKRLLDRTVLPQEPSDTAFGDAIAGAAGYVLPAQSGGSATLGSEAFVLAAIDEMTAKLLRRGWGKLAPAPDTNATSVDMLRTPGSPDDWLNAALDAVRQDELGAGWLGGSLQDRLAYWQVILLKRLHQLARAVLEGTALSPARSGAAVTLNRYEHGIVLLACAILRLRQMRLALVVSLRDQMFGSVDPATLRVQRNGIPQVTAGALGQEIEASLGLEAWRGLPEAPVWPALATDLPKGSGDQTAYQAHVAARDLELTFADVEAAGAEAGSVFQIEQDKRLTTANAAILASLGTTDPVGQPYLMLRRQGLEPREQPARGLFALPGPRPDVAALTAAANPIADHFDQKTALQEARGTARVPRLRYDHDSLYSVWCWVRVAGRDACEAPVLVWTQASEPFSIAEPTDVLGARPATITLPNISRLIRDIPRIAKSKARPFAGFAAPANSGYTTGDDPKDTQRAWGIGFVCSFGIPVLTICAYILFSIIFSVLILIPGFFWMLLLKFCIPIPVPKKSP